MTKRSNLKDLAAQFRQEAPADQTSPPAPVDDVDAALEARLAAARAVDSPAIATTEVDAPKSMPTTAANKQRRRGTAKRPTQRPAVAMTKATVQLPVRVAEQLRAAKNGTNRTSADLIVSAYLSHLETLREQFEPTEEDRRRIELGLPTLAAAEADTDPADVRTQVGLYVSVAALQEIDGAAKDLSMSRSSLVERLLRVAFQ